MALFSISDLHLSLATPKPMDVFGHRWQGYTEKLRQRWCAVVSDKDTVVIPGDVSWAMKLHEAEADLKFIDSLPGKKIIGKGNHDYWWSTLGKMNAFLEKIGVTTISFLHNNAYIAEEHIICGTRGWFLEERLQNINDADYTLVAAREASRLKAGLDEAMKLRETEEGQGLPIIAYLHFPPVFGDFVCEEMVSLMKEYGVSHCFYGHIHGKYDVPKTTVYDSIPMTIISADYLDFIPYLTLSN